MKKVLKIFGLLMMTVAFLPMMSCGGDDKDEPDGYYDFSVEWDVVDRGDYTVAEAKATAADLTEASEDLFEGMTEKEAKEYFDEFMQQLRYEWSTNYKKITLRATLYRNEGHKKIMSRTMYIDPDGSSVHAPAKIVIE